MNKKDVVISMRMPSEIHQAIKARAAEESRTIAGQILHYLKQALANKK